MPARDLKGTLTRRLAIMQMFPEGGETPNQRILSEMFGTYQQAIYLDLKCIREIREALTSLKAEYESAFNKPAPPSPPRKRKKKWGRRTATKFAGKSEDFKTQTSESQDDENDRGGTDAATENGSSD